jgi:hypothetical protein
MGGVGLRGKRASIPSVFLFILYICVWGASGLQSRKSMGTKMWKRGEEMMP